MYLARNGVIGRPRLPGRSQDRFDLAVRAPVARFMSETDAIKSSVQPEFRSVTSFVITAVSLWTSDHYSKNKNVSHENSGLGCDTAFPTQTSALVKGKYESGPWR